MTVQIRKPVPKEPRSSDEIRYLYIEQLLAAIQAYQDEWDADLDSFLAGLSDEDRDEEWVQEMIAWAAETNNRCFEMEIFDAGEPAFIAENLFVFRFPKGYSLTKTELAILEAPDVVWSYPRVSIGLRDVLCHGNVEDPRWAVNANEWDDHLVVEVLLIDG